MKKAWLLKSSQVKTLVRAFGFLLFSAIILVQFQNCAPAQMKTEDSKSGSTKQASSGSNTSTTKSPSGSGGGFGTSNGGSSSGGSSSSGGGFGSSGGGGSSSGGSSGGGGFGGGGSSSGGSSGGSGSQGIYFVNQPASVTVDEFASFQIEARVSGGTPPYTYKWYKDNAALTQNFYILSLVADNWNVEGSYYVVAKDANGASVQSSVARVGVREPAVGCNAGTYFTLSSTTYDWNNLTAGFLNGPRGQYLLPRGFPGSEVFSSMPTSYSGVHNYTFGAVAYLGKATLDCRSIVPKIHTPTTNPGSGTTEWGSANYSDSSDWKYEGAIQFECRNQKLKLVSNTCAWKNTPPPPDYGGGY